MPSIEPIFSDIFAPLQSMTMLSAMARLGLALLLGALIGWEREVKSRAAGLRTHMLITLAAAMFTIVAMELTHFPAERADTLRIDPLRLIEAVTAGVAFLAAGSIITSGGNVRGVTTGASMWLCGAIGLACGTGSGLLATMGTGLALVILWVIRQTLKPMAHHDRD
ncbi:MULTISPECIES: MgtC/SapB family protein [unclassified Paracoccus (in: a-proteobacteria)]|jgi:putative Mg2+ transporter-C (MgtC) family protein|uniref:MgtC/SapB family protein n=1 Tax=unclassified Paracoccus (in: a-proteobacteria) TaxID=2688777 RepID=UPI001FFE1A69|nr:MULTISPECIES: MgtC/SapB family protein [unclassified Paracoccus (in: a-proteobacteria)]